MYLFDFYQVKAKDLNRLKDLLKQAHIFSVCSRSLKVIYSQDKIKKNFSKWNSEMYEFVT